jgi:hypothetical protein
MPLPAVLVLNPVDDAEFAQAVSEAAAVTQDPTTLEIRLRVRYPAVVVRPRQLSGEARATYYVYRDGRWVAGHAPD